MHQLFVYKTHICISPVKQIWNGCSLHGVKTNAPGVGILLNNNFKYEVIECHDDTNGNYIQIYLKCSSTSINLINVYALNHDDPDFFKEVKDLVFKGDFDYVILCGDLNLVLDPKKDSYNYNIVNNPKARIATLDFINELDLLDVYRTLHTYTKCCTW